jgi:hypothetical protein
MSEIKIVGTYLTPEQRQKFYQQKNRKRRLEEKFQRIITKMMERQK